MVEETKNLTELQKAFLEHLFGEAQGDILKAKELAGYSSETNTKAIVDSVAEEIVVMARKYIATNSPKAVFELFDIMKNPNKAASSIKLKAVESILEKANISRQESITDSVKSGIVILPPKNTKIEITVTNEE